jgi:hypothetical protein
VKLSEGDEFGIKTIAVFVNYQDLLDNKVITKAMFDHAYDEFDEAQKSIISGFLTERMAFNEKFIKQLGNEIGKKEG